MFSQARSKSHIAHKRLLRGGGAKGGPGGTQQSFIRGSTATPVRGPTPYPSELQVLTIKVPLSFFQTVPLSTDPV